MELKVERTWVLSTQDWFCPDETLHPIPTRNLCERDALPTELIPPKTCGQILIHSTPAGSPSSPPIVTPAAFPLVHLDPSKSTTQQLVKVPQISRLYRHVLNRGYYGIKKVGGKRKEHALGTTDRKLAERRLKVWLENSEKIDTSVERLTLQELVEKLQKANAGMTSKTQATDRSIIKNGSGHEPID
jgi:hypothetical protein